MIFDVDAAQISRLDSSALVQLLKRLLLAECQLVGIPLRAAGVPLQITMPDGGEDGRLEWAGGIDSTNYLPSRFSIFQSKAQNLTEGSVKAEILAVSGKGRRNKVEATLNEAVSEALTRGGSYVVFCSHPFTGQKIKKLRKAIETAIAQTGAIPSQLARIDVYDANKIADWVNTHPAVALWVTSRERRRSAFGFQSLEGWGRSAEIARVPWVGNGARRFIPTGRMVSDGELNVQRHDGWTFAQAAEAARKHLWEDHSIVRIIGPSGFGKSRFAYELFNGQDAIADHIDAHAVIYSLLPIIGDEVAKLALEISDAAWPAILVVDDCPDDMHSTLAGITQRAGSRLRLVTIDVETKMHKAEDTLVISLAPASDELIGSIAKGVAPTLDDADARFIKELANGFPRMAVLAAQRGGKRRDAIVSIDQVLDRIIWGKRPYNDEAQKALEISSLFNWLGLSGRVGEQAAYVAREFAGMSEDAFVEGLKSFTPRGIIVERGDFVQVQPIPLAARLAAQRLSLLPDGRLGAFFMRASPELRMSILQRLRWLDTSPAAQAFAKQMLQENCLGNLGALNSGFGSEAIDHVVHIEPDAVMATIDRVLGSLTLDQLRDLKEGRRHIVWALEKLAFRNKTFKRAAILLRRLGAAETEGHIENNARGQFTQLYQLYLSGTQAELKDRLLVLDQGLQSDARNERGLCVGALGRMLQTGHFTRVGGADEIGSERLEDWSPKTYGEVWDFHRAAMNRLTDIATRDDEYAEQARGLLSSHIRGLLNVLPFEDVKAMIERIITHAGIWIEAIQSINNWLYFDRREAPKELGDKVRGFFNQLIPTDPVDLVVLYTRGGQGSFDDPDADFNPDDPAGHDYKYAVREACRLTDPIARDQKLLDSVLDRLVTSEAKTVFHFSRRLAELASDPVKLFTKALRIAETRSEPANTQFFGGLISGTDQHDPQKARDCVRAALQSSKLKNDAISMIGSGRLQPEDLRSVVSLLQSGDVDPWQCATLSYGRGLDHLTPEQIMPLLDELGRHGATGHWVVMHVISMYLYGGKPLSDLMAEKLKSTLFARDLFDDVPGQTRNGYDLEQATKLLLQYGKLDQNSIGTYVKQLLMICYNNEMFYQLVGFIRSILVSLLASFPNRVWSEVSKVLTSKDSRVRFYADHIFLSPDDNNLGPGLLHTLPSTVYLDWVRIAPGDRAAAVIKWLPIVTICSDGTRTWHPELEAFVSEFGDQPRVLVGLERRLRPKSWSGSVVPHLEPILPLLDKWAHNHAQPQVRRWAQEQIEFINSEIEANRRADEERNAGIY